MEDFTLNTETIRIATTAFRTSFITKDEFDRWLAEVKAQAHKEEREYLIQYLQSEIKNANEWCEENKDYCTPEDIVKNSMVIATYENLAETLITNPYRQGED